MSDIFCEAIVKKQPDSKDLMKKVGAIILTILIVIASPFIPFVGILVVAAAIAFDYFLFKRLNIEYEYALTMTDLDVAKIMSKEKRKQLLTLDLKQADIIGPANHQKVKDVDTNALKVIDCTSGQSSKNVYAVITKQDGKGVKLLFEPSETMINGIRKQLPSKTVIEWR